jgi:hypothetical protein
MAQQSTVKANDKGIILPLQSFSQHTWISQYGIHGIFFGCRLKTADARKSYFPKKQE